MDHNTWNMLKKPQTWIIVFVIGMGCVIFDKAASGPPPDGTLINTVYPELMGWNELFLLGACIITMLGIHTWLIYNGNGIKEGVKDGRS